MPSNPPERPPKRNESNPFSTRNFQPGSIPFLTPDDSSISQIASQASEAGFCYLIVGPHGSGKSTLLQSLHREFEQREFEHTVSATKGEVSSILFLQPQNRPVRRLWAAMGQWSTGVPVFIDGFEQIPTWIAWYVRWRIRGLKSVCFATSHQMHAGCKVLWRTSIDADIERRVIERLLSDRPSEDVEKLLGSQAWKNSRSKNQQNLRESLFDMYDWWPSYADSRDLDPS